MDPSLSERNRHAIQQGSVWPQVGMQQTQPVGQTLLFHQHTVSIKVVKEKKLLLNLSSFTQLVIPSQPLNP
jgi:hypothetical protein